MNLREARFRRGKNQYDLTIATGIHQSRISLIECGYAKPTEWEKSALLETLKIENLDFDEVEVRQNG